MTWNIGPGMGRNFAAACAAGIVAALFCTPAFAEPKKKGNLEIIRIIDHTAVLRFEVVESDLVAYLKKDVSNESRAAREQWAKDREVWKEQYAKIDYPLPEPVKMEFKVVGRGFASKGDAEIEVDNIKARGPFAIIQVVKGDERQNPKIVMNDEVRLEEYAADLKYGKAVQDWCARKTAFETENPGQAFDEAAPQRPEIKVLKKGLKTMEQAGEAMERYAS